jgi:sulfide:quinone oxidoreductase
VIAGGGVAAIEALLALRELVGTRVTITLISPQREFVYRPVTVTEPFGHGEARAFQLGEIVDHAGGRLVWDRVERVDPSASTVLLGSGDTVGYDRLIVACGAIPSEPLPGALTFRGRDDVEGLRDVLDDLTSGSARSVALTLTSEHTWTLPIYELALMTSGYLRDRGVDSDVSLVTPEEEPLELFGPAAVEAMEAMLKARHVHLRTSARPVLLRGRMLQLAGGGHVWADRVITLPELKGPRLPGLPHDRDGFIWVDGHGRVHGAPGVYAAGDVTAFPLRQGGLAAQQADAVAENIAAELGAAVKPRPFAPVLRGLLMTGGAPLYVRSEPQRLARGSSVATEAPSLRPRGREPSAASGQPLWWPPAKIAGRYLSPFLATARPQPLSSGLLTDRIAIGGPSLSEAEFEDALGLALLLADCDARWGDYPAALSALDAAEALRGALPPEYEHKRRSWRAAERMGVRSA